MLSKVVGTNLRRERERQNLPLKHFADLLKVSASTLHRNETGGTEITFDFLYAYCAELRVAPADMLPPWPLVTVGC